MSLYSIFMGLNSILMAYIRLHAAHHDTKNCDKDCKEIQDLVPKESEEQKGGSPWIRL